MKKVINIIILLIIFGLISIIGLALWLFKSDYLNLTFKNKDSEVILIEKGDNLRKVAQKLEIYDVFNKPVTSFLLMKLLLGKETFHAGEYEVVKGETLLDFISKLRHKVHYYRKITFVEGETITKYKDQISSSFGLVGEITEQVSEGYFMPGTYKYLYGETKNSILKRAKEDMLNFVNSEFEKVPNKESFYIKNIHELLSLASVVEKESGIGLERKLIAGVFYNRLKKGMKLQSDPTTIYEITKGRYKLDRPLTFNDLKMEGEYNTYYIKAIPIAPIASPSKEAIIAVLNPEKTDSIFFVADGAGGHNFSVTYDEHKENIKKYKQALKENEAGK